MLLHLIPQLLSLKVVIVGKKIGQIEKEIKCEVELCNVCSAGNKTLFIEMIKLSYVSYVERKYFKAPHIVIAYDFEENDVHLWSESVKKMMKIRAPFVMTTSTKQRAQTEHEKMTDLFGYLTSKSFFKKNPFAGDRPYRDAQEDGLKFSNNYVAVYSLYEEKRDKKPKKKRRNRESEIEWPDFVLEEEREQRRQKMLARQKEAAQAASQSTDDSEDNPDKNSPGQKKLKKKKKTAKQTSDSGRENNSPEKEEKSKNIKKEDDSEALNSSNKVKESEELLGDQTFNPPDQDEEIIPSPEENVKDKDDLMDKEVPRTKVPSLKKVTEDESGKSNSEKQRSDFTYQKEECASTSGYNLPKFGESSTGKKNSSKQNEGTESEESIDAQKSGTFKLPAVEQDKSEMEGSSKSKKKKNKKKSKNQESTESSNKKELVEQQNESNSSKQNEMLEKNKKPRGQSVDSEQSEEKVQEQKEGSKKSRKRKNKKLKNQESAQLNIEKGEPAENQDKPLEEKEESSDSESAQGLALIAKKTANLQDENVLLQRKINQLAAHYSDLKSNGEKMGHDLLRQIAMMKESLEILEHRVRNALESNEEV